MAQSVSAWYLYENLLETPFVQLICTIQTGENIGSIYDTDTVNM